MRTWHGPDLPAQESLWFPVILRQRIDVQAALIKMICIARRTDDGNLPAAQPMLSDAGANRISSGVRSAAKAAI
jgi:hypothetical protein